MWQYRKVTFPSYSAPVSSCIKYRLRLHWLAELVPWNWFLGSITWRTKTKTIFLDRNEYIHPSTVKGTKNKEFIRSQTNKTKYLFLNYGRNEDEAKYLLLNYRRNKDEAKYLLLNYRRNEDEAKSLLLNYRRNEDEAKYLFPNYWRNEDKAKLLFLNYLRNEDEAKYSFLNCHLFAIATPNHPFPLPSFWVSLLIRRNRS